MTNSYVLVDTLNHHTDVDICNDIVLSLDGSCEFCKRYHAVAILVLWFLFHIRKYHIWGNFKGFTFFREQLEKIHS